MTLELIRLTSEVSVIGEQMLSRSERLGRLRVEAADLLEREPKVTDELLRKIQRAREIDEWRRGAVPRGDKLDERRRVTTPVPQAVLIAADGSQIFPDRNSAVVYYLLNIGAIVFRAGSGEAPSCDSRPQLFYRDAEVYDPDGNVRTEEYVGAQRNRLELQTLADRALAEREALGGDTSVPMIALIDGPLLPWIRSGSENSEIINEEIDAFASQMKRLRAANVIPVGYVDRPRSAYVLRILELIETPIEAMTRDTLRTARFIGLTDSQLFSQLGPNERSGLFVANSQSNERYFVRSGLNGGAGDRIAFCYANFAREGREFDPAIARLEFPGWAADHPEWLDIAQGAIADNCEPGPYPYVLARAHELALVSEDEQAALDDLLSQVMWRNGMVPRISTKAWTKQLTGRGQRR